MAQKLFLQVYAEVVELLQEYESFQEASPWLKEYLSYIKKQFQSLQGESLSKREKQRIQKACNADLRDFHIVCQGAYQNVHTTSVCPDWMQWREGSADEFFAQLLENLKLLDAKTLHILSLSTPKTLTSYEEHVYTLKKLKNQKTSRKDYEKLLAIKLSLMGNKRLFK